MRASLFVPLLLLLALFGGWVGAHADPTRSAGQEPDGATPQAAPTDLERARWKQREGELLARIQRLKAQLGAAQERSLRRELEWADYIKAIARLPLEVLPDAPAFLPGADREQASAVDEAPAAEQGSPSARERERSAARLRTLDSLLVAEQILALEVLELGALGDGWTGPVVLRLLDERGRPVGLLAAERLRLEVSRAGHSVSLVFEEGYERHAGRKVPFSTPDQAGSDRGGVRRISLPGIDPRPWIEALPELIGEVDLDLEADDGLWDLWSLRARVDSLLRAADSSEYWRLKSLGGVVGSELRDVQLVERDRSGSEVRRLFADRMRIKVGDSRGVQLELRAGVQLRAGKRAPFLADVYRVYLPRARTAAWREANLPGVRAPEAPAPAPGGDEARAGD